MGKRQIENAQRRGAGEAMNYLFSLRWKSRFKFALRLLIMPECNKLADWLHRLPTRWANFKKKLRRTI